MPEGAQSTQPEPRGDATAILLARAREGDAAARTELVTRYLPVLTRIAHGRLPLRARGPADTDDLVQTTVLKAFSRINRFEFRHEGGFLAYLRQIMLNQIRDEVRRASRMDRQTETGGDLADSNPTPLQAAIGRQTLEAYDAALSRLRSAQRQAVVLRVEFGFDYAQVAEALGLPSANAARLLVSRALVRLASQLRKFTNVT